MSFDSKNQDDLEYVIKHPLTKNLINVSDINIKNIYGSTAIASAYLNHHTEVVEVLRQAGAIQDFL